MNRRGQQGDPMTAPGILWFRQDLRLRDNPALSAALDRAGRRGGGLLLLYILDDETPGDWRIGGAGRWWLHHSLAALARAVAARGGRLLLRRGRADVVLAAVIAESGADAVFWNRCYEPWAVARDKTIKAKLQEDGLAAHSFNGALLMEPWDLATKDGGPYQVFTPFWRRLREALALDRPIAAPRALPPPGRELCSVDLEDLTLLPRSPDWAGGLRDSWTPGEDGAQRRLDDFLAKGLPAYGAARDRPGEDGTSRLSPHLHWGEISPRQVWQRIGLAEGADSSQEKFLSELAWRDFSHHLLYHHPHLPERNLRPAFDAFPWQPDAALLKAWQAGRTGIPLVDAGMRQLRASGWMHNRVRMVAASFLVKHLLQPWQVGAAWFWDNLVDADLANNSASWQWVAGCGADAAPYFRIFNPVLQSERFDPAGDYLRRWLPELADLPSERIHKPWTLAAPPKRYPAPVVDLAAGRRRALAAYEALRTAND